MSENKKKVKNDNTNNCAFCMAPAKNKCSRCQLVYYCDKECQKKHWKEGHKYSCFSPEERKASKQPDPRAAEESENFEECCICLDSMSEGTLTLDCGHTFHKDCIDELRKKGVQQVCPLCRAELPDTPEKMFADGCQLFFQINKSAEKKADGSWRKLNKNQKNKMSKVLNLWNKAADQGIAQAQFNLGNMYKNGQGVAQDYSAAMKWYRMAADQGDADAQYYIEDIYKNGYGMAQNILIAKEWYQKASNRGNSHAINKLKRMADNDCIANRTRKRMKQTN